MEWISCKDRLPEKSGAYIVTFIWGDVSVSIDKMNFLLSGNHYRWTWDKFRNRDMTDAVKAWLPYEPYMGD